MLPPATSLPFISWGLAVCVAASTLGDTDVSEQLDQTEIREGQPIDRGFVILNGQYLPAPYTVAERGEDVLVNGHVIPHLSAGGFRGPRGGMRGPSGRRGPRWARGRPSAGASVEPFLLNDGLLIVLDEKTARLISRERALSVLDILLADLANDAKVQALVEEGTQWISSAEWAQLVDTFEPTPELRRRAAPFLDQWKAVAQQNQASHERLMSTAIFRSKPVQYSITVGTMVLVVIAIGTLLNYRPNANSRWRDVDSAGDGVPIVMRNVLLVCLFGLLDLLLTLLAQQAGGFSELNPLASRLDGSPIFLAGFKVISLLVGCGILVTLRRYRGAQIASWWLCLACTILTFRWLTYNSMFLT